MNRIVPRLLVGLAIVLNISAFGSFFVWFSQSDFMFGHFTGPPELIMAALILSLLGVVSTILWLITQFSSRRQANRSRSWTRVLGNVAIIAITAPALIIVPIGVEGWSDARDKLRRAKVARVASEARDVPTLLLKLDDKDYEVRMRAARKLSELYWVSHEAVPKLIEVASRREESTSLYIVQVFGKMDHRAKGAIPILLELLKEPSPLGPAAAEALTGIGKDADPALLDASRSSDPKIREYTARALGKYALPPIGVVGRLTEMLDDSNAGVRTAAAGSLGRHKIASDPALPELERLLNDSDPKVRAAAEKAIRKISRAVSNYLRERVVALNSEDKIARSTAARVFGNRGAKSHAQLPALRSLMDDPEPSVRFEAAKSVYKIGDDPDDVIPTFIELLNLGEEHRKILYGVTLYLADMGPPAIRAVPPLEALLSHNDPAVRRNAKTAITFITDPPPWKVRQLRGEPEGEDPLK